MNDHEFLLQWMRELEQMGAHNPLQYGVMNTKHVYDRLHKQMFEPPPEPPRKCYPTMRLRFINRSIAKSPMGDFAVKILQQLWCPIGIDKTDKDCDWRDVPLDEGA